MIECDETSDTPLADGCYVTVRMDTPRDEQTQPSAYLFAAIKEDAARIAAYHAGAWHFQGVVAVATLNIVRNHRAAIFVLRSPGIWAVESDGRGEYAAQCYRDERRQLLALIAANTDLPIIVDGDA